MAFLPLTVRYLFELIKCLYKNQSFAVVVLGFFFETMDFKGKIISSTIIREKCCLLNYSKNLKI